MNKGQIEIEHQMMGPCTVHTDLDKTIKDQCFIIQKSMWLLCTFGFMLPVTLKITQYR